MAMPNVEAVAKRRGTHLLRQHLLCKIVEVAEVVGPVFEVRLASVDTR